MCLSCERAGILNLIENKCEVGSLFLHFMFIE